MKIGLVGYQGSGKSSLFEFLTGVKAEPALAHASQSAMAAVPEERVEPLCGIYHPKKVTLASLEIVDTAGLSRTHEGNPTRLSLIREAGCLVLVIGALVWALIESARLGLAHPAIVAALVAGVWFCWALVARPETDLLTPPWFTETLHRLQIHRRTSRTSCPIRSREPPPPPATVRGVAPPNQCHSRSRRQ
jgi:GTPase SAR1 family protein